LSSDKIKREELTSFMKRFAIAIDLGATNLRVALISQRGKIFQKKFVPTPQSRSSQVIINEIVSLIQTTIKESRITINQIKGIGISAAAPVDINKGKIVNPPNIPCREISPIETLKKKFHLPVILYNDCAAAVWGEKYFGKGKKYKNIVYITISSGIGGGIISNNRLLLGRSGSAGEIGHFNIAAPYNFPCGCKKGINHWEGFCSGNNLPRFFKFWQKTHNIVPPYRIHNAKEIFDLAKTKDKIVLKFLKEINKFNALGISNVIVAYDPEIIILGGAVVLNNQKIILSGIKNNVEKYLPTPKIVVTSLKNDVSLFGAAALLFWPPS